MTTGLGFDDVEALLEAAARDPTENISRRPPKDSEKERRRRRSAERSRSRSRDRRTDAARGRRGGQAEPERESATREAEERARLEQSRRDAEEERQKAIDDATRGDRTVMVASLPLKCDERDLYEFFTGAGNKVRDVQIIRDSRTGRSKGVGYIEFYSTEFAMKALSLNGQPLRGHQLRIQPSQAERNRMGSTLADGTPVLSQTPALGALGAAPAEPSLKLFVGGLVDKLAGLTEDDLRKLFGPFGELELVELQVGFAFVHFRRAADGRDAVAALNNFIVKGQELKVGIAGSESAAGVTMPPPPSAAQRLALEDVGSPSHCVALRGVFASSEVDLKADPNFYKELEEEIAEECQKFGRPQGVHASRATKRDAGTVWIRFKSVNAAMSCRSALHKRWFGGKQISARFVSEATYQAAAG